MEKISSYQKLKRRNELLEKKILGLQVEMQYLILEPNSQKGLEISTKYKMIYKILEEADRQVWYGDGVEGKKFEGFQGIFSE